MRTVAHDHASKAASNHCCSVNMSQTCGLAYKLAHARVRAYLAQVGVGCARRVGL